MVTSDPAIGTVVVGAQPGDQDPKICVWRREVNVSGTNMMAYRTSQYAFTGETIMFDIVVRDPNGIIDIGFPKIRVADQPEVLCSEFTGTPPATCDGMGALQTSTIDKLYECILTVDPQWYTNPSAMNSSVYITAYNSSGSVANGTHFESWYFNPALSMSVTTSDGQAISFEQLPYGANGHDERWVHSTNRLIVKNTAEAGVNMWMYLAGTDLTDPGGASLCPTSNVLNLHGPGVGGVLDPDGVLAGTDDTGMAFRGWTGTMTGDWRWMSNYDVNGACEMVTPGTVDTDPCYGGKAVPKTGELGEEAFGNLLTNQGTLEVEFKLNYPMPCIGTFSQGTIYIFGKPV